MARLQTLLALRDPFAGGTTPAPALVDPHPADQPPFTTAVTYAPSRWKRAACGGMTKLCYLVGRSGNRGFLSRQFLMLKIMVSQKPQRSIPPTPRPKFAESVRRYDSRTADIPRLAPEACRATRELLGSCRRSARLHGSPCSLSEPRVIVFAV